MDVHRLQLPWLASFLAVVDEGSMTAAAVALHLSQPRVSAHVAALENVVGAALFEREARGVTLTALGQRFLPRARRVFDELKAAADDLEAARGRIEGRLRIGSYPGASAVLIAPLLARYRAQHRAVEVELFDADAARLDRAVASGKVDFAVRAAGPPRAAGLPATPLCQEKIVALAPSDGGGPHGGTFGDLGFLTGATVIVSGDPQGGWADYRDRLTEVGAEPARVMVAAMPTTVAAFVRAGLGIGILGAFAAAAVNATGTTTVDLPAPLWRRDVRIIRAERTASPPLGAFLRLLRRHGPALTEGLAVW